MRFYRLLHFIPSTVKEYTDEDDAEFFLRDEYYDNWSHTFTKTEKNVASRICGGTFAPQSTRMRECYKTIDYIMNTCPPIREPLLVFRVGRVGEVQKPYVSASLLRNVARSNFSGEMNYIILPAGTLAYPSFALTEAREIAGEFEIIIDNRFLKGNFGRYTYTRLAL